MYKKIIFILLGFSFLSCFIYAQSFWGGKTMSAQEVKVKWGNIPFDSQKFISGSYEEKAKMSYSIMQDKQFIGKSVSEIRKIFGPQEGFYFVDTFPAYIIQRGKNHSEETWQIVFRLNRKSKVRDVIMHKNCCEKE